MDAEECVGGEGEARQSKLCPLRALPETSSSDDQVLDHHSFALHITVRRCSSLAARVHHEIGKGSTVHAPEKGSGGGGNRPAGSLRQGWRRRRRERRGHRRRR
uniref:Uncharacterized protein n=1 Tax=Arundo donax TaxID=35708 RepID=A0A0A9AZP9_ARUDO